MAPHSRLLPGDSRGVQPQIQHFRLSNDRAEYGAAIAIVDEFAHTNVPGCENVKRWQDVHVLLEAGIDVLTTMNVQHLESLYDIIEQFAGVKVKERVPDYVLGLADQIVNVDLSAEDLQERLKAGKVGAVSSLSAARMFGSVS